MPRLNHLWPYAALLAVAVTACLLGTSSEGPATRDAGPAVSAGPSSEGTEDLDRFRAVATLHRFDARKRIARELLAGRLTLLEAAERFRDLAEANPEFSWEGFRSRFPGASDDERHARHVIYAVGMEGDDPGRARVVVARLEAELSEALRRGSFRLAQ